MSSRDIATALELIDRLGLTLDDLNNASRTPVQAPIFRDYIIHLRAALPATTTRAYDSYWRIVERRWGDRRLDEPTPPEITALVEEHRRAALRRSNSRDGHGAAMLLVAALRCLYRHAEQDRIIAARDNPAAKVDRPRTLPSARHALSLSQIDELAEVTSSTGDDPELDILIVRLHLETACRRGGALRLEVDDLDDRHCQVCLREKGGTMRWQPISPTLATNLRAHVVTRGGSAAGPGLLRYSTGRRVGRGRYTYLRDRWHERLPWAASLGVSAHWLRHTTVTFVEREFGAAVAHAFAGQADPRHGGTTGLYTRASLAEIAEAVEAIAGEPHPLARNRRHPLADHRAPGSEPPRSPATDSGAA
ncbi:tyrosine-type recombinase/integrase [Nocardia jiangsuensis]|uniref:Tyrosine-type recombinase/integrase n=1 Tax=Nocardia jiangsuensis TaxID=1691563 RepID=A0ABV8E176_9NOCA